jgi:beta-phosphoglucomutase
LSRRYEAILFDFDGVIADTEPVHYDCWVEVLAPFGITLSWDRYAAQCIGVSDREMIDRLCRERVPPVEFDTLWADYPRKKEMFRERVLQGAPVPESTRRLLAELGEYKMAVVSSSGRTEVEPALIHAGIRPFFEVLVCGKEVEKLKPAPDPYLRAAELLGVTRALVVEDSDAGEASGRAAGFDVLRVTSAAEVAERVRQAIA